MSQERGRLSSLNSLANAGLIEETKREALRPVADSYAIAVTPTLTRQIDRTDPADPIARMFIPSVEELTRTQEELADPIGDATHTPAKGIVHRYPNRVLLKPVGVCPVYCRFCFRREMVGPENAETLSPDELQSALAYIRENPAIREVILTGGDPFMLSAKRVAALTDSLGAIPHVKIIRWHTRMPVADPLRITQEFIEALTSKSCTVYISVHINHLNELSADARVAIRNMADAGLPLLSQTVLLRGVNDRAETLADLFHALTENRVQPYYLHHPDLAPGTGHFRLSVEEGQAIYADLRDQVSGIALPHYVIDIPGGVSKANAARSEVSGEGEALELRGRDGQQHPYSPGVPER
ncbi:MAG: lysine 2,3-aminomutase [Ponticaulis sp.]|nr:lysine 2,3-aminomutase [Ponticaulis sp.]|tara:strand:- start:14721 stop:15782 length:1062 start_codon:yes stop_codon:yes gene_type:complete